MSTDGLLDRARRALKRSWGFQRPPHAFVLSGDRLVHVALPEAGRGGRAAAPPRVSAREIPAGTFREGPAGVPVAGPGLAPVIGSLLPAKDRITAASLAVPDGFVKSAVVDVEPAVARSPRELSEVLRWKASRLYAEPVPLLRVSWSAAGTSSDGGPRYLVLASPEESVASLEAAFAAHGVRIGAVEPAALALSALASEAIGGSGLVLFTDGPNVSTVFLDGGAVRFLRTRETAADPEQALQEIRLSASFVGGGADPDAGLDVVGAAVVVPESAPVSERFREFRSGSGGREPSSLLPALVARGVVTRAEDPALLVGLGLLRGAE